MADKFFLPSLVPAIIITLNQPSRRLWNGIFVSICVFLVFFEAASFFNFTPWDLSHLLHMLAFDNLVVEGGKAPWQQIVLYPWDIIACSGLITSVLALIGCFSLLRRCGMSRLQLAVENWRKENNLWRRCKETKFGLRWPNSVIVAPLLFHAALIVTAQVHYSRHILVFVPIVCLLAAIAVETASAKLRFASLPLRAVGSISIIAVLAIQFADGMVTDWIYPADIRAELGHFLDDKQLAVKTSTFTNYTNLKDVSVTQNLPETPFFISCDIEYQRYILAGQGKTVFHTYGGKPRTDFFVSLFAGQTSYVAIFDVKRSKRLSVEDHLAEKGWLPNIDTYVPNECRAFQKNEAQT